LAACSSVFTFRCVRSGSGGACGWDLDGCRGGPGSTARVAIGSTVERVIASWMCAFCAGWPYR
jgi:hypothetical protein